MVLLEPIYDETIWGGTRLCSESSDKTMRIGQLYSIFDRDRSNIIQNGTYAGKLFHEYFEDNKSKFHLEQYTYYPVVVALVDAADHLSIQVHPDDAIAKRLDVQSNGKNESWYFIEAPSAGWIYNGCKYSSLEQVKDMIRSNQIKEITDHLNVETGDYVYVSAGTLHALTKGSFVCEIEENSALTYRFYDYGRVDSLGNPRELHVEKALQALKTTNQSRTRKYNATEISERMYTTKLLYGVEQYQNRSQTLESITLLKGHLIIEGIQCYAGCGILLEPGESVLLTGCEAMMVRPNTDFGFQ